ncbi:MAG: sialidase family protein [Acidimicrobiales bacterium]
MTLLEEDSSRAAPGRRPGAALLALAVAGVLSTVAGAAVASGLVSLGASVPEGVPLIRADLPATAMDEVAAPANNSPLLLQDPTDPSFVVLANRLDAPDFSCALQVSSDGGRTFGPAAPVVELPPGAEKCYAPEVAFDADGSLYYLFVGLAGPGNEPVGAFLTTSADGARTFTAPRRVLGPLNYSVRMAIDPEIGERGRLHLVWLHATSDPPLGGFGPLPNPILAAYSDDGGNSFSEPVQVNDDDHRRVLGPALAIGPDHAVHVAYYDLRDDIRDYQGLEGPVYDGTWSMVLATSTDAGKSFRPGVVVDDGLEPSTRVMLVFTMPPPALVAARGRACVGWTDARYGDDDALVRCSGDQGRTWGPMRRLNDDPPGNGASQYLPRLAVAPDGRIDAVYYDRRGDPSNLAASVSYTYSTDGIRFAPAVALTREPSDTRIGQQYAGAAAEGLVEFGSRLALLARPRGAVAAWPDTRNSAELTTAQDIFATEIDLRYSETDPGWGRPLGIVAVAAGLGMAGAAVRKRRAPAEAAL